jgi:hypothetical protein
MNALIHNIEALLINSGCTLVVYETDNLSNIRTDESNATDIVGVIVQPNEVLLQVKANAITERPILTVEILQQVRPEDLVYNNEHTLQDLLEIVKVFIYKAIAAQIFQKITDVTITKVKESKYDANLIGWSIPINWVLITNEDKCVIVSPGEGVYVPVE